MALRDLRGAGRRRAPGGRAGPVAVGLAVYVGAGLLALSPALRHARSDFLAYGTPPKTAVAPGDHLQSAYNLWLPGHQLAHGRAPWRDPYSFQPEADERTNFAAWPFAVAFGPLEALFGTAAGWNAFVLLTYVGAGGVTALWLRALGLPLWAALAGGLAFALAPYRSAQTAGGHLLGPVSMLLPLALWALERRATWLAVAAIASIPLSGQVHLALGAIIFSVVYAVVRRRAVAGVAGAAAGMLAGALVYLAAIRGTVGAGGRSFAQVERFSAEPLDLVVRHARHGLESFVFLGWLLPALALAGLVLLGRRARGMGPEASPGFAATLALGAAVPVVLALGANTPLYEPVWRLVPGLRHTRVPERLLPIACLCLAALAAVAVARLPWRGLSIAVVPLLLLDLRVDIYRPLGSDQGNAAYAALRAAPPGRLLELPVFPPDRQEGSVYLYYAMQAPRERPLGYSTTAPPAADRLARRLHDSCAAGELRELGVRYVARHSRLASPGPPADEPRCPGGRVLARAGGVVVLTYP